MESISELFNGALQRNWSKDAGLSTTLVIPLLAVTGLIYISVKVLSFIRVILSLFILPGKPVCSKLNFLLHLSSDKTVLL